MVHEVEMSLNVLACIRLKDAKPDKPPFQVFFPTREIRPVPSEPPTTFEEHKLGKFKSYVPVPTGTNVRVRVKIGAYGDGDGAETYGHILEVLSTPTKPSASPSKA